MSAICALHCLVLPALLSFSMFTGLALLEHPAMEVGVVVYSGIIGVVSLLPSYFRHHRKFVPIIMFVTGMLALNMSWFHLAIDPSACMVCGAVLIASAHFLNYRYCKKHRAT